ncbi:glycosyl transferase [Bacteroidia bacterium]|nr:glycosyl transferase [Bacteroidia bacterium]
MKNTIFFFHPSSELYGADKILVYIMKNFPNDEKNLILRTNGPLIDLVKEECPDVNIHIIPTLPVIAKKNFTPTGIFKFISALASFKKNVNQVVQEAPTIVYLNTLAVVPILFYYKNAKKIVHVHEILKNNNLLHRIINKIAVKKSDAVICVSNAVSKNLAEVTPPQLTTKLRIVHNGISFKTQVAESTTVFETDPQMLNFALIGRIKPTHKGQCLLLDAIAKLPPNCLAQCRFYFVGSPVPGQEYMQDEVVAKIKDLNLNEKVTIIPFVKEIEQVYKKIDVVIVPSTFDDPFPTTVLEAMFWQKPVIGTMVGGIPEMIHDKETGLLVDRDDADDLAAKIMFFINSRSSIQEMGKKGKAYFEKNFSEESFVLRYNKGVKDLVR